jgi:uncharacterized protein
MIRQASRNLMEQPMRIPAILSACVLGAMLCATLPPPAAADEAASKRTYLVIYRPGPAWLPGKPLAQQNLQGHSAYMLSLYSKGLLKIAGPFIDDTGGGAVLLETADEAQARDLVAQDPAVKNGVFLHELRPWYLVSWEQRLKTPQ